MVSKKYISPDNLHEYSVQLAKSVLKDDFKPTWIIALWRGGCFPGSIVQGYLRHYGINSDHIAIRTSSYDTEGNQHIVKIYGLSYIVENIKNTDKILVVDDVFDSGRTIAALINELKSKSRANFPADPNDFRVATIFYKPDNNKTNIVPNYYFEETSDWLVFPHEFEDLTREEIKEFMGIDM